MKDVFLKVKINDWGVFCGRGFNSIQFNSILGSSFDIRITVVTSTSYHLSLGPIVLVVLVPSKSVLIIRTWLVPDSYGTVPYRTVRTERSGCMQCDGVRA